MICRCRDSYVSKKLRTWDPICLYIPPRSVCCRFLICMLNINPHQGSGSLARRIRTTWPSCTQQPSEWCETPSGLFYPLICSLFSWKTYITHFHTIIACSIPPSPPQYPPPPKTVRYQKARTILPKETWQTGSSMLLSRSVASLPTSKLRGPHSPYLCTHVHILPHRV
ncbi:hypothetical protein BDV28DRAFT_135954 [Aspergillus coremiiformis]|uniref:Uncharacterized protein n=1 Tax=Aspergillus coremiiformis TaxID=138285 RepID=A0A5N6Z2W9_9EURO|nr:hypothetical protein BDV28DRAFT_135954 [Aspergillus coremiiformis]